VPLLLYVSLLQELRSISLEVATAVALAAKEAGVAEKTGLPGDKPGMREFIMQAMWAPNPELTD
jgi:hypothetical protein